MRCSDLQRVEYPLGQGPGCPLCGGMLTALQEKAGRAAGGWSAWEVVLVRGEPCGCDVTDHAAELQKERREGT